MAMTRNYYSSSNQDRTLIPIEKLNFLKQNVLWKIKAAVYYKSEIRTYKKSKRTIGNYFTVELRDESGAIKAVAFNLACDMLFSILEVNKTYYISRCTIKRSDRRFNTLSHGYELLFEPYSQISLCPNANLPTTYQTKTKVDQLIKKIWVLYELPKKLNSGTQKELFHVEATILHIKNDIDEVVYTACPLDYCKKKVVRTDDRKETYYCEKCHKKFPNFNYRYALKVQIADWSGNVWVTLFGAAESFLGISAPDIVKQHEQNYSVYQSYFEKRLLGIHTFVLEAKMELYDDLNQISGVGANYYKIDYAQSCRNLIHDIKRLIK